MIYIIFLPPRPKYRPGKSVRETVVSLSSRNREDSNWSGNVLLVGQVCTRGFLICLNVLHLLTSMFLRQSFHPCISGSPPLSRFVYTHAQRTFIYKKDEDESRSKVNRLYRLIETDDPQRGYVFRTEIRGGFC